LTINDAYREHNNGGSRRPCDDVYAPSAVYRLSAKPPRAVIYKISVQGLAVGGIRAFGGLLLQGHKYFIGRGRKQNRLRFSRCRAANLAEKYVFVDGGRNISLYDMGSKYAVVLLALWLHIHEAEIVFFRGRLHEGLHTPKSNGNLRAYFKDEKHRPPHGSLVWRVQVDSAQGYARTAAGDK
jgi:hypothetical protein